MNTNASRFFVAGGTLRPNAPSYVARPADAELLNAALAGEFCYVLTPRQMGKSSLMARTARELERRGVQTAIVDLTAVGTTGSQEEWYLGFLAEVQTALGLETDIAAWWQARAGVSTTQRFSAYLREVVLAECPGRVVIFVDEIDSTLALNFRDDFFAALRALYNARALTLELERLSFVLLGVAAPTDLIADPARTPFNVGHAIALQEFSRADAAALLPGLETAYPGQGEAILARIYDWTNGYPYLTQKLCLAAVEQAAADPWDAARVDALVQRLFLAEDARNETNLKFVQDKVLSHPQRVELLRLYRRVLSGDVPDDAQNSLHNTLKLVGLVKAENGILRVRNEVYRKVFDLVWVREQLKSQDNRTCLIFLVAVLASIIAICAVGLIAYGAWVDSRVRGAYYDFDKTDVPAERLHALAQIFRQKNPLNPRGYARDAHELFFGLSRAEQLALFQTGMNDADLTTTIDGLYMTLADVDETGATTLLLEAMRDALPETRARHIELAAWLEGRTLYAQGQYTEALESYTRAVNENYANLAIWYEKARVRLELGQTTEALQDLEEALAQANKSNEPTPTPEPTEQPGTEETEIPVRTPTTTPVATATPGGMTLTPVTATSAPTSAPVEQAPTPAVLTVTPTPTTIPTPTPTATPESTGIQSQFRDLGQIRRAIKTLIYRYPAAALALDEAGDEQYFYLREAGLVLTLTLTPIPETTLPPSHTPTATPTLSPETTSIPSTTPTSPQIIISTITSTLTPIPNPIATATSTPTFTPIPVTSTPSPIILISPDYGPHRSPQVRFEWRVIPGVSYQVTVYHLNYGQESFTSEMITVGWWDYDLGKIIEDSQGSWVGDWEWYVTSSEGMRSVTKGFSLDPGFRSPDKTVFPTPSPTWTRPPAQAITHYSLPNIKIRKLG